MAQARSAPGWLEALAIPSMAEEPAEEPPVSEKKEKKIYPVIENKLSVLAALETF